MTRRRTPVTALFLVVAGLGFDRNASAQYRPPPPLPEPVPPVEPLPAPTPSAEERSLSVGLAAPVRRLGWGWEPGFVVDGGWEKNIGFTRPPGPDDVFGDLRVSLARVRRGPRSDFRLDVSGVGYVYREVTNRNRVDAFARLATQGPLSRRVEGSLRGNYDFAHTDSEGSLIDAGVLFPLDRTQTAGAGTGLTWRAAERTSLSLDGSWTRVDFESNRFVDTTTWTGALVLTQRVSRRDDLSLRGSFQRTEDDLSTRQGPTASAGYGHVFSSSLRLTLAAGASREETISSVPEQTYEPRWDFYGSANLSGRIRRNTLSIAYQHGLRPTIGLGISEVTDSLSLGLTSPVGRRLELLANGSFASRTNPLATDTSARKDWDAYVGASCRLAGQLRLVVGYRFRVREDTIGALRNDRATVSLSYEDRAR